MENKYFDTVDKTTACEKNEITRNESKKKIANSCKYECLSLDDNSFLCMLELCANFLYGRAKSLFIFCTII